MSITIKYVKLGLLKIQNFQNINDTFDSINTETTSLSTSIAGLTADINTINGLFTNTPTANKVPKYDSAGVIKSNAPTVDLDVANKKYVDDAVANIDSSGIQDQLDEKLDKKPNGATDLILGSGSNSKLNVEYFPDYLLGQLRYGGTWNASTGIITPTDLFEITTPLSTDDIGWYFICTAAGNIAPKLSTNITSSWTTSLSMPVNIGDWAVFQSINSSGIALFGKVDNTDAVTMVNGQIGSVDTYKGDFNSSTTYYKGDIVLSNDILWLSKTTVAASSNTPINSPDWIAFGKTYNKATDSDLGIIKTGSTINSENTTNNTYEFGVKLNSTDNAYVEVPKANENTPGLVSLSDVKNATAGLSFYNTVTFTASSFSTFVDADNVSRSKFQIQKPNVSTNTTSQIINVYNSTNKCEADVAIIDDTASISIVVDTGSEFSGYAVLAVLNK